MGLVAVFLIEGRSIEKKMKNKEFNKIFQELSAYSTQINQSELAGDKHCAEDLPIKISEEMMENLQKTYEHIEGIQNTYGYLLIFCISQ